ncbi:MAG: hypothetical protein JWN25_3065 [Verrucomicrobiales bacterium]|nr:hypothetical protein [Verrucomicrobiales bacterium]MDB6131693.1 hypothetical protein [Verrucomicrobiales bacterium]
MNGVHGEVELGSRGKQRMSDYRRLPGIATPSVSFAMSLKIPILGGSFVLPQPGGRHAIPCWDKASASSEACDFILFAGWPYRWMSVFMSAIGK